MSKQNICVLFGGKSAEHDISLRSAINVMQAIDRDRYNVHLVGISKTGEWIYRHDNALLLQDPASAQPTLNVEGLRVCLPPQCQGKLYGLDTPLSDDLVFDCVIPVLHGPLGEDGAIQGVLKIADVPFVGPDVLGAAVGMDKAVMKSLLRDAGIPIGEYRTYRADQPLPSFEEAAEILGTPLYVKPANMGSSVGISRVNHAGEWDPALEEAFKYDQKIVVEANISGRELECAVLGNANPVASTVGEVAKSVDFYDYENKYLLESKAEARIPATIGEAAIERVRTIAVKAYKTLQCEGLGRVDVFFTEEGDILVNEINTIPGFTSISMYPKLWEYSGLLPQQLIGRLIELAIDRHRQQHAFLGAL